MKKIKYVSFSDATSKIGGFNALLGTVMAAVFRQMIQKDWLRNLSKKIRRDLLEEKSEKEVPSKEDLCKKLNSRVSIQSIYNLYDKIEQME